MSTTALRCDVAVSGFEKCLRVRNIHELKRRVSHFLSLTDIQNASLCAMRLFVTSWLPLAVQCLCSVVSIACHPLASSMDSVANLVAECLALDERLIFQSVSKNISLQLEEELEHESWILSRMTIRTFRGNEWEEYCYETQNASPTSSIDGVAGMVAEWLSLGERLTLQSVRRTFRVSWNTNSSAECGTLSRTTIGPCSVTNGTNTATSTQRNAFAFFEG